MQDIRLHFSDKENYRVREAFRTLRSNVEFSGQGVRVVALTSCTPNEGKTSCAMNLARAFAESGKRTILVDADMRKSIMVGRYKTGSVRLGLTHYLVGQEALDMVICRSDIKNLHIILAGPVPPNPSELLGSERFTEMIRRLREDYEYVIVDTPPLGSVIDAAVVSRSCDGVVLIIENNAVSYRFVQHVKEQLDVAGARILGVVLNKVNMDGKGYYGHYGNYYGRYYGKYYRKYYGKYDEDNAARMRTKKTGAGGGERRGAPVKKTPTGAGWREAVNIELERDDDERQPDSLQRDRRFGKALRDNEIGKEKYVTAGEDT
ncbi:MAG: polysaccharide biosynthesis tyrosine autokinase [Lachnospiraceae bacterium]|nr:polysaccharide biosynthesis tyrosine autokinase [Lachnospiraceae bacterium]